MTGRATVVLDELWITVVVDDETVTLSSVDAGMPRAPSPPTCFAAGR